MVKLLANKRIKISHKIWLFGIMIGKKNTKTHIENSTH